MSAIRTQIYLSEDQRRRIDSIAEAEGVSLAAIVRRALDSYLEAAAPSADGALATTFGAIPDMVAPDRSEWERA
jgi:predicted transcriptional regulator